MKTQTIVIISVIVAVALILYLGYRLYSNRNTDGGFTPSADENCAAFKFAEGEMFKGSCTKPLFSVVGSVQQRCWKAHDLGLPAEAWTEGTAITKQYKDGQKKWYYNYKNGDTICFVDNKSYPM